LIFLLTVLITIPPLAWAGEQVMLEQAAADRHGAMMIKRDIDRDLAQEL
jgi:hypothetical protein